MRIIVSDSSCLIDLRKVGLVEAFLKLPYEFLIPNTRPRMKPKYAKRPPMLVMRGLVSITQGQRVERYDRCEHPSGPHPMHTPCGWFAAKTQGAMACP